MSAADILVWPAAVLKPQQVLPSPVPMSRSGGVTLGGTEFPTRTDTGYWSIAFKGVLLGTPAHRKQWNLVRTRAGGRAGLLAVPVVSFDTSPWAAGTVNGRTLTTHSDGTRFSDGGRYSQPTIIVEMVEAAAIGARLVTLRRIAGIDELSGVRFSYNHALYETGMPTLVDGDDWTVEIFPAIRAAIPAGAALEFDLPTCLVHLATDRAMDVSLSIGNVDRRDVAFLEATDYWSALAAPP